MPQRRTRRHPIVTIILLLLVTASALVIVKVFVDRQNAESDQNQTTIIEVKPAEKQEEETTEEKVIPIQNEGEDPNQLESLTGNLTTNRVSNGKLILRVNINQYLSTGICNLTLTSGSNTITKTANIVAVASTSTCEGFDVPVSELSSGAWQISINIQSGDKTGTITGEQNI